MMVEGESFEEKQTFKFRSSPKSEDLEDVKATSVKTGVAAPDQ